MSVIWSTYEVNFHSFFKKWSSEYGNVCILPKPYKTVVIDFQLEICQAIYCSFIKLAWNLPKVEPEIMGDQTIQGMIMKFGIIWSNEMRLLIMKCEIWSKNGKMMYYEVKLLRIKQNASYMK